MFPASPQQRNEWREAGMCETCGRVQTHEKVLFGYVRRRLTVEHKVFEGICLRCNTIMSAKLQRNKPINHLDCMSVGMRRTMLGAPSGITNNPPNEFIEAPAEGFSTEIIGLREDVSDSSMDGSANMSGSCRIDSPAMTNENEENREQSREENGDNDSQIQGTLHQRTEDDGQIRANLDDASTAPGVDVVNDGDIYTSELRRKRAGEAGSFAAVERQRGFGRIDALIREKNETRSLISECASCCELLYILKEKSYSADILIKAFEKFRDLLLTSQEMTDHLMPNKDWPKTFAAIMSSRYTANATVQSELLHTLWSIASLNQRYISDLTSVAEMKDIIHVMETHINDEYVQQYGCGLLACIGSSQKRALGLLRACSGKTVQLLMNALQSTASSNGNIQKNSLKALFRVSSAALSSDTPSEFFEVVCSARGDIHHGNSLAGVMHTIIQSMQRFSKNTSLQTNGFRLLWNILESDIVVGDDRCDLLLGKTIQHALAIKVHHQKSRAFHETIICILSKISCFGHNSFAFGGRALPLFVVEAMLAHPKTSIVALHGCRCITNVCEQSPEPDLCQQAIASSNGVHAIIACMETFQEHLIVQSEACSALYAVCNNSPQNKEQAWRLGGIDRIVCAYESYGWDEEMCTSTKIRACIALACLFLGSHEILADIRNKGLIQRFEDEYSDSSVPDKLRHAIQQLLASEACERLRESINEIRTRRAIAENSGADTLSTSVKAMKRFPKCAGVQEIGCKLLACTFASTNAELDCDSQTYETIILSLEESLTLMADKTENVAAACSALRNLCILQVSYPCDLFDIPLESFVREVVNSMTLHEDNVSILEHTSGALWALFCVGMQNDLALPCAADNTTSTVTRTMNRFPESYQLQKNGIGVLWALFSVSEKGADFIDDELVTAVLRFIRESDVADDTITAIEIISIFLTGFTVEIFLKNETLIDSIVGCMYRYPHSPSIQGASIDILSKIASLGVKREICQSGGTSRIINALDSMQQDRPVVCKAYAALACLVGGADIEILRAHNAPAVMVRVMLAHPQVLPIQTGATHALWALASCAGFFKDDIVHLGGAEAVAEAITRFIGSKQMQANGVGLIWSLAVPNHKSRVGRCTIEPLVNGLSAHISAEDICSDGLGCIKSLSMHPENRELLEENGALELIYSCMWRHSGNSSVCEASLAALCNLSVSADPDLGDLVLQITTEDLQPICFVMKTHAYVRGVQKLAIILLKNFTLSPSNILVLGMHPSIAALIQAARSTFHDSFGGRADYLLQILAPHHTRH